MITPEGIATLEDLSSTNGTFLNGRPIETYPLRDGDKFHIGPNAVLKFSYQDELERDFHQALIDTEIRDPLTGIYAKKYVLDQIVTECAHAQRHRSSLALLIFDVDRFVEINNMYGIPAGNFVIKTLARIVRRELRTDDVFARYGAGRFIVFARDISNNGAVVLARRIRRAIRSRKIVFVDVPLPVTVSLGIGTLSNKIGKPSRLIRLAENYLHRAKSAGRGCIAGAVVKTARP
jgi:diguanylate cyclase (GGDEF)-like protein